MRNLLCFLAGAFADYCFNHQSLALRVALEGNSIRVHASAPAAWVGVGVPRTATETRMPDGNFVMGGLGQLFDYTLTLDDSHKPNSASQSVSGGSVTTSGSYTNISFTRLLAPPQAGLNAINVSRPFNLLWAYGSVNPSLTGYAALNYHQQTKGHVTVGLTNSNCGPPTPSVSTRVGPRVKKGKNKGAKSGKAADQVPLLVSNRVVVIVNSQTFTATLLNNTSTQAFRARLPLTLNMVDLNRNEKYYDFPIDLPTSPANIGSVRNGDLTLYGSRTLVLFYKSFPTSYSYTRLGQIDNPSELEAALGVGSATVTFA